MNKWMDYNDNTSGRFHQCHEEVGTLSFHINANRLSRFNYKEIITKLSLFRSLFAKYHDHKLEFTALYEKYLSYSI